MLDPAVVKASYYCDAMTPCLCKVVMFSQITRCTVDFWHDTSFSHFPFLLHLHSLTIAAGAHFPTKWFTFCHFTRVQLAEAEKNAQCKAAQLRLLLSSSTGHGESLEVSWASVQETMLSFLSTLISFLLTFRDTGMGNHWNMSHCSLLIFGADLWNDTKINAAFERKCSLHGQSKELGSIPDSAVGFPCNLAQDFLLCIGSHS